MNDGPDGGAQRVLFLYKPPVAHLAHVSLVHQIGISEEKAMAPAGISGIRDALRSAWCLARSDAWDSLFSEGPCFEGMFLRAFDRARRARVRLDMGSTALRIAEYPAWERVVRRVEMRSWSAIVVTDSEAAAAMRRYAGPDTELIEWTPKAGWGDPFGEVVAERTGRVVSIMQGLVGATASRVESRLRHKGLDRVAGVSRVGSTEGWGPITLYGEWPDFVHERYAGSLHFAGKGNADDMLRGTSVLVHTCRQDGFGLAVLDAMVAGVPPVVSRAGAAKLVAAVEPRLVVEHDPDEHEAVEAVRWVRGLDDAAYRRLGSELRAEALRYLTDPDLAVERIRARLGCRHRAA
ncbi:MAG: glycosyltransferase [Acidimicrobiales bacterium]